MTLVLNLISGFISFLIHPFLKQKDPVQKVDQLPELNQSDFPVLRSETEAGRLLSNARSNHTNDCQIVFAVMTDIARAQKKWGPISHSFLTFEIKRSIFSTSTSVDVSEIIETAFKKGIIEVIELSHALYIIPNNKKFKKHLNQNFIPELNT